MLVRSALAHEVVELYRMRVWLGVNEGKIVCCGGFRSDGERNWAFLDVFGKVKPLTLVRAMHTALELFATAPVYVMQDETFPQSAKLLTFLGFTPTDETHYEMKVWKWPHSH